MRGVFIGFACCLGASCVTEAPPKRNPTRIEVARERPGDNGASGAFLWGLDTDHSGLRRTAAEPTPQDPPQQEAEEARIRNQFGSSVIIGADGRVTKQYFLVGDLGTTFLKLVADITQEPPPAGAPVKPLPPGTVIGGDDSKSILGRMLGGRQIEVAFVPDFESLAGAPITDGAGTNPAVPRVTGAPLRSERDGASSVGLLLVTAVPSALAAFESALNQFYSSIPQIEITVKVVEYSKADALAFGISQIDPAVPILQNLDSNQLIQQFTSVFPLRQPVVAGNPVTDFGSLTVGGIHNSWELNAALEMLEANNAADVTSSPKMVVRNGGVASISTVTEIPFPKAKIDQLGATVSTDIAFKPVGVKMNIIPVIAGTETVLLQVYADVSAVTSYASTEPVVTPVTSTRSAVTTVYLKDMHTLVIGGLNSVSQIDSETKVPILGDIPILGYLFRSTSQTRQETNIAFHITPRIVQDRGAPAEGRSL